MRTRRRDGKPAQIARGDYPNCPAQPGYRDRSRWHRRAPRYRPGCGALLPHQPAFAGGALDRGLAGVDAELGQHRSDVVVDGAH